MVACVDCDDTGEEWDPNWCGDEEHCSPMITCRSCGGRAVCPIKECGADERGTANGSKPMFCHGYGTLDPRCMANWASADPEDRESYAEYLRDLETKKS